MGRDLSIDYFLTAARPEPQPIRVDIAANGVQEQRITQRAALISVRGAPFMRDVPAGVQVCESAPAAEPPWEPVPADGFGLFRLVPSGSSGAPSG